MKVHSQILRILPAAMLFLAACQDRAIESTETTEAEPAVEAANPRFDIYAPFTLTADLSGLSDAQRQMIPLLIQASEIMDELFWRQPLLVVFSKCLAPEQFVHDLGRLDKQRNHLSLRIG